MAAPQSCPKPPKSTAPEHLLTRRAETIEIGEKLVERIRWWRITPPETAARWTTIRLPETSVATDDHPGKVAWRSREGWYGAAQRVYKFGEKIDAKGFVFMDSPGFDPCSVTGQVASGANLIVFTTGRGSVSGYKPTPCIKLATNSEMYEKLSEDMDLNCGDIVTEGVSIEEKGKELFELIIRVASGERTKSEELGFGGAEFVPWQIGAVM